MNIFLCWSGERSKETASILSWWLGRVIQSADPWYSDDIPKGSPWAAELADRLEKAQFGIICLNQENLDEKWILYEAGALSKTKNANVCTFLLDINPSEIEPPLSQFQCTLYKEDDFFKLVKTINEKINKDNPVKDEILRETFDKLWPELKKKLDNIPDKIPPAKKKPIRGTREILEEMLGLLRSTKPQEKMLEEILGLLRFRQYPLPLGEGNVMNLGLTPSRHLSYIDERGSLETGTPEAGTPIISHKNIAGSNAGVSPPDAEEPH